MDNISILEKATSNMICVDIYSKLLQNNIIFINDDVSTETVSQWQAQIFYLMQNLASTENPTIKLYINSCGGSVYDLLGFISVMNWCKEQGYTIETYNLGLAASAASTILMNGSKGHRYSLKYSTTMLHELSSYQGYQKLSDSRIGYEESERLMNQLKEIIKNCSCEEAANATRDRWLSAEQAKDLNIIDNIL